jgi:hypothetical protein
MKMGGVKTYIYNKGLFLPFCLKNLINTKQVFVEFCFENYLEYRKWSN